MWQPVLVLVACCLASAACGRNRLLDGNDPLGSPGELAWQAWLLMDGASSTSGNGGAEAGGARRITPKSVFIAPAFAPQSLPPCADGTKRDAAGRCVQLVHINRDAQLNFLLQRLNALHARPAPPIVFPAPPPRPLPYAPQRAPDAGPFKVPLMVPLPTPSTAPPPPPPPPTTPPSEDVTTSSAATPSDTESMLVSVVMADVSKRSSAEQASNDSSNVFSRPTITVWTLENNTLHKTEDVEGDDAAFTVEIPTTTEAAGEGEEEEGDDTTGETKTPPKDVLAPSAMEGALPMLVISTGTTLPAAPTMDAPGTEPDASNTTAQEGSGEPPQSAADGIDSEREENEEEEKEVVVQRDDPGAPTGFGTSTVQQDGEVRDSVLSEKEDDRELGSADVMEHIEVVPISENSRHQLPIMGEDQDQETSFSQAGLAGGIAGIMRPIPVEVLHSPQHGEEVPPYSSNPIRFPSDVSDEPRTVHLFKGNFIKFPTEHAYRYRHKPVTEPLSDVKQSFWWLPSNWRADQARHQPPQQDFWSRTPSSEDTSPLSQYNPSYHSPLPYQQRQAQYDPQWSSMKKQMTS